MLLALYVIVSELRRNHRARRQRRRDDRAFAELVALSWVTGLYARHGTDEQLEGLYGYGPRATRTNWHRGCGCDD